VIPPNKDLSILHGVLHLLEPAAPRGLRLPIDFFFRSLPSSTNWQIGDFTPEAWARQTQSLLHAA
jgi:hypothetical protein